MNCAAALGIGLLHRINQQVACVHYQSPRTRPSFAAGNAICDAGSLEQSGITAHLNYELLEHHVPELRQDRP